MAASRGDFVIVVLSGSHGLIGWELIRHLQNDGHEVIQLHRDANNRFTNLPERADAVINLAGENILGRWTDAKQHRIQESRLEATRQLVTWANWLDKPLKAFLSASAVGFYGHRPNELLTETSTADPEKRFRYRVCWRWEHEALNAEHRSRVVLLRFGNVMAFHKGYLHELLRRFRFLPPAYLGNKYRMVPWISLNDAARMVCFALQNENVQGPMNVVAPRIASHEEIINMVGSIVGMKPRFDVPEKLIRLTMGHMADAILDDQNVVPEVADRHGFRWNEPTLDSLRARLPAKLSRWTRLSTAQD